MKKYSRIYIFAPGLLGGSIGLGLKSRGFNGEIVGIGRAESLSSLKKAKSRKAIDHYFTEISEVFRFGEDSGPALAVVCSPVGSISKNVASLAEHTRFPLLITDVGSTKSEIIAQTGHLPNGCRFIGSHPIAGSEKSGPENADPDLFAGKTTIVTPIEGDSETDITEIEDFWTALGSVVVRMNPERHDQILARTSHLPHLISSLLVNILEDEFAAYAGSGFRDMTRLAAGGAQMWAEIMAANSDQVYKAIDEFVNSLENFRNAVTSGDEAAIHTTLDAARQKSEHFFRDT